MNQVDIGDAQKFSGLVRFLRTQKGWTQSQLSKESGIPERTVKQVESGEGNPTQSTMSALCRALGYSLNANEMDTGIMRNSDWDELIRYGLDDYHYLNRPIVINAPNMDDAAKALSSVLDAASDDFRVLICDNGDICYKWGTQWNTSPVRDDIFESKGLIELEQLDFDEEHGNPHGNTFWNDMIRFICNQYESLFMKLFPFMDPNFYEEFNADTSFTTFESYLYGLRDAWDKENGKKEYGHSIDSLIWSLKSVPLFDVFDKDVVSAFDKYDGPVLIKETGDWIQSEIAYIIMKCIIKYSTSDRPLLLIGINANCPYEMSTKLNRGVKSVGIYPSFRITKQKVWSMLNDDQTVISYHEDAVDKSCIGKVMGDNTSLHDVLSMKKRIEELGRGESTVVKYTSLI